MAGIMKSAFALTFIVGCSVASLSRAPYEPVGICPAEDGKFPVYLPDSKNCSIFYECSHGRPFALDCPAGLHFSPTENVCARPEEAGCKANENPVRASRSAVGKCPATPGWYPDYLADSEDCAAFYECSNGEPIELHCAPGTSWNDISKRCDTYNNDVCFGTESKKVTPKSAVGECPATPGWYPDYLADSEDCAAFYECSNGEPIKLLCAPGTSWNDISKRCDTYNNDVCFGTESKKVTPKSAVGECPATPGWYPDYLADSEDCTAFYECSNGEAIKLTCAPGTSWNDVNKRCDATNNDECFGAAAQKMTKSPVGECPAVPGPYPAYLADSEDCTSFYECSNGEPFKLTCAPGTSWNDSMKRCDTSQNNECFEASRKSNPKTKVQREIGADSKFPSRFQKLADFLIKRKQ